MWVGEHRKKEQDKTPTPYDSYENVDMDNWFKHYRGSLRGVVDRILPKGRRLVYKCSPYKALVAHKQLPDSTLILCHRKFKSIIKSSPDGTLQQRKDQLATIETIDAPIVDVDAVIARDFSTIHAAIEHCGIEFDAAVTESCIDDSLWHHK